MTWESVTREGHSTTDRLKVPGGWIYRTIHQINYGVALVFVPELSEVPRG